MNGSADTSIELKSGCRGGLLDASSLASIDCVFVTSSHAGFAACRHATVRYFVVRKQY